MENKPQRAGVMKHLSERLGGKMTPIWDIER